MDFEIIKDSVVNAKSDAIVNAANEYLLAGGGVCGAIFEKAGREILQAECDKIGYCNTGDAVITSGCNLCKYIIHAVGPVYYGRKQDSELLSSVYEKSLKLADDNHITSIAFPCISTGIFGYPLIDATRIAISVVKKYKPINSLKKVYFYCYTELEYETYLKISGEV